MGRPSRAACAAVSRFSSTHGDAAQLRLRADRIRAPVPLSVVDGRLSQVILSAPDLSICGGR